MHSAQYSLRNTRCFLIAFFCPAGELAEERFVLNCYHRFIYITFFYLSLLTLNCLLFNKTMSILVINNLPRISLSLVIVVKLYTIYVSWHCLIYNLVLVRPIFIMLLVVYSCRTSFSLTIYLAVFSLFEPTQWCEAIRSIYLFYSAIDNSVNND